LRVGILLLFSIGKSRDSLHVIYEQYLGMFLNIRAFLEYAGSPSPECCVSSVEMNFSKLLLHNFNVPTPARCTGCLGCRLSPWARELLIQKPGPSEGHLRMEKVWEGLKGSWRQMNEGCIFSNFNILPEGQPDEKVWFSGEGSANGFSL